MELDPEITDAEAPIDNHDSSSPTGADRPTPRFSRYATSPMQVLTGNFAIGQLIFNILASTLGPLGTFYLLFGYLSTGPYDWSSGALVGVVVGSLAGSPLLIFALMPVGLPEAVKYGWFLPLRQDDCPDWMRRFLPFLSDEPQWRWGTKRNLLLGLWLGVVAFVPIPLLLARFVFGPVLDTWSLIVFNVVFEVFLAVPVLMLGLLGYALEQNLRWTLDRMSNQPNCGRRLLYRTGASLKMTVCPPGPDRSE